MMHDRPMDSKFQASMAAWVDRPIDLANVAGSVGAWHAGRPGSFDLVAVHKDQVAGCPASVRECEGRK